MFSSLYPQQILGHIKSLQKGIYNINEIDLLHQVGILQFLASPVKVSTG